MNAPLAKEQIALLMSDSLTYRMSPVQGTDATIADARPTFWQRAARAVAGRLRHRAVLSQLAMLTDRELADIGLDRAELGRAFGR